ncbi:MAG: fatty acid desaturase [Leptospiraceae bacterium]|nr:fatty acid desaturase [Leptospiraceae bacterium]
MFWGFLSVGLCEEKRIKSYKDSIPESLNLALLVFAVFSTIAFLFLSSRTDNWVLKFTFAILFSYSNNTIFSLLHESVHSLFHSTQAINNWAGRIAAAFFPTGFMFQRVCHLGHHSRNRTNAELFDYYQKGENRTLKYLQWYGILTGIYWLLAPLACILYLLFPSFFNVSGKTSKIYKQTGANAMLSGFESAPTIQIRLEILFTIFIQTSVFVLLGISFSDWFLCYFAFALNWCSLQYADHAWSPLDIKNGAWNLRVNKLVQYIFLNYHHHLAHHQHPEVSWIHLPSYVDFEKTRPYFWKIYLKMWLGPRPYPSQ